MNFYTLILQLGLTLVFVGLAAAGIFWAIKNGQYDDMEGPAQRILMDDDDPMIPFNKPELKQQAALELKQNANQHKIDKS